MRYVENGPDSDLRCASVPICTKRSDSKRCWIFKAVRNFSQKTLLDVEASLAINRTSKNFLLAINVRQDFRRRCFRLYPMVSITGWSNRHLCSCCNWIASKWRYLESWLAVHWARRSRYSVSESLDGHCLKQGLHSDVIIDSIHTYRFCAISTNRHSFTQGSNRHKYGINGQSCACGCAGSKPQKF